MLKNVFRKAATIFLAVSVIVSTVPVGASENYELNIETDSQYKLLRDIGIYNSEDVEKLGTSATVSRGAYLSYILRAMKHDINYVGESVFADVTPDMKYYSNVMNAYELGLIYGYEGSYRADENITNIEAVAIALRALGYGDYCSFRGYPSGYSDTARDLDLIKGAFPAHNEPLNMDYMTGMLVNMLTVPILTMHGMESGNIQMNNYEDETLLSKYFDIYETKGIVEANSYTNLSYVNDYREDHIQIGKNVIKVSSKDQNNYLGYYVHAFYRYTENDGAKLVYIAREDNEETIVDAKDIIKGDSNEIKYSIEDRVKKIKVDMNTKYIYNGKALDMNTQYNSTIFNFRSGNLKAIYNNHDNVADVILITRYDNIVFSTYSQDEEIIYDQLGNNIDLTEKDYLLLGANDEEISFSSLTKDDILSVSESLDGEYFYIKASFKRVTGTVENIELLSANQEIAVIDGVEYYLADEINSPRADRIYFGLKGTFFLSADGKIVYAKELMGDRGKIGVLHSLTPIDDGDTIYRAQILTTESSRLRAFFAEKLVLDGNRMKDEKVADALLKGNVSISPMVIMYKLDEEGKLIEIDTAEPLGTMESEETLHKICEKTDTLTYKSGDGNFGKKFYPSEKPVFFGFPTSPSDDFEKYAITRPRNDYKDNVELYSFGGNPMVYDIGVLFGNYTNNVARIDDDTNLAVVNKVTVSMNEGGELLRKVSLYEKTDIIEEYLSPECEADCLPLLEPGNVIRYGLNNEGYIGIVDKIYDAQTKTFTADVDDNGMYDSNDNSDNSYISNRVTFSTGYVYQKHGNYFSVVSGSNLSGSEIPYAYPIKSDKVFVVKKDDSRRNGYKVVEMSADNIRDYDGFGSRAHKVIAGTIYDQSHDYFYFMFIDEEE